MLVKWNFLRLDSLLLAVALLALIACSDSSNRPRPIEPPVAEPTVDALYDASASPPVLPYPNAVYAAENGRLNMPLPANTTPGDLGDAVVALNTLDGFSTIAPMHVDFAEAIDSTTIAAGDNVRVFEVAVDSRNVPTEVLAELLADEDYSVTVSAVMDSRLLVKPLRPLKSSSHYLMGIDNELRADSGLRMGASAGYANLRDGEVGSADGSLDQQYLSELIQAQEALLVESGMEDGAIVSSFSFPTHSTSDVLDGVNAAATARNVSLIRPTMMRDGVEQALTSAP